MLCEGASRNTSDRFFINTRYIQLVYVSTLDPCVRAAIICTNVTTETWFKVSKKRWTLQVMLVRILRTIICPCVIIEALHLDCFHYGNLRWVILRLTAVCR